LGGLRKLAQGAEGDRAWRWRRSAARSADGWRGFDGDETIMKKLDKGAFLLPAPDAEGAPFVTLRPSMLPRLFRS